MEAEKTARLLYLYEDLISGAGIRKRDAANRFEVNERSIQRDILRKSFMTQKKRSIA